MTIERGLRLAAGVVGCAFAGVTSGGVSVGIRLLVGEGVMVGGRGVSLGSGVALGAGVAYALGQASLAKSGAVIFLTAIIERTRWKYRQRAYRYIYLDAGHIGGNICLACESLGLGTCPIGAFYDDELNSILGVDGTEETVVYAFTVGR